MDLPPGLRSAVDAALAGVSTDRLAGAAALLSSRYRGEVRDGRFHVDGEDAVLAYLAARLPATYAATRRAMGYVAGMLPDFAPVTLLDLGAGPGTASFAAADCWPGLVSATLCEGSAAMRRAAERLAGSDTLSRTIAVMDLAGRLPELAAHDLVVVAYVLDEMEADQRRRLVEAAWAAATGLLLIVEPGTPAGWQRILDARASLIAAGAHVAAPCPHEEPCPLLPPDWCHFAARLPRSRTHLRTKQASVPFEDEKFIYLAASRRAPESPGARVLSPPRAGSGRVSLKLCEGDGQVRERLVTRREGDDFRVARRADWGDSLPLAVNRRDKSA
ncbi:methyltransferase type 11 [Kaistia geumhonensis]|uniref:Ribosomal protein RSM22 (Predicted rRNA methylase) n=1 Tax=Kaistia geumhonensis TaxID=410839 RepID=A0ABU0MBP0_9HYPH|nr:small ribosomal subunit Rsm22 family protein [Kaistia geumhonensis]MCX5481310.1 methyltransferase type 11 [Kaistia geumhonensis]MDQ0518371.1 ribosomal protein RSM22 (predicted rRNA methylase) [Kaistia geumhonensis]